MSEPKSTASSGLEQMFTLLLTTQKTLAFISPDIPMLAIASAIEQRKNAGKDYQSSRRYAERGVSVRCSRKLCKQGRA